MQWPKQAGGSIFHAGGVPKGPSDVSTQLCTLLVRNMRSQGVYDVQQQLLAQHPECGQLGDLHNEPDSHKSQGGQLSPLEAQPGQDLG